MKEVMTNPFIDKSFKNFIMIMEYQNLYRVKLKLTFNIKIVFSI